MKKKFFICWKRFLLKVETEELTDELIKYRGFHIERIQLIFYKNTRHKHKFLIFCK